MHTSYPPSYAVTSPPVFRLKDIFGSHGPFMTIKRAAKPATASSEQQNGSRRSSGTTATPSDVEQHAATSEKQVDVPPDGGYGWVCVACCFLINAHTWGINSSYGVFLSYYLANNYYPGATSLEFAFVGGLSIS